MSRLASGRERLYREEGFIVKDWGGRLPVAVVYPSPYYIGMSNLGVHSLYRILNADSDVVAERFFWEGDGAPLLSLESRRPLADFAVVAFSIPYELDYLNVPMVFRSAGIPLRATERDGRHPLVIGGGACITANPMPLAPFFDCLCIGEAEPLLPPLLAALGASSREECLEALLSLPGCYVPQHHQSTPIVRQWAEDLDVFATTSVILTPDTEFGRLYLMEVERGCNFGCRFCLARSTFCPQRFRSIESLLVQATAGLKYRKRLGLVGPVVSTYPHLEELLVKLRQMGAAFSISSLRAKPLSKAAIKELALGGVRSLAMAPEAGSERLRQLIGKGISEDDILQAVDRIAAHGIRQLKLYFMLGLPTESNDDASAIITLALKCKAVVDSYGYGGRLSLNVAPFVPKAGTPFQWLPMAAGTDIKRRLQRLERELQPKGIKVKSESIAWSEVQAVMARGDASVADVLAALTDVSLPGWRRAVVDKGLDIDYYAHQRWPLETRLPWEAIDLGLSGEQLDVGLKTALSE